MQSNASTVSEFAETWKVSVTTLYKAQRLGHLRITKLFGKSLILAEDGKAFLEAVAAGKLAGPKRPGRKPKPPKAA
jgi:hypothetical protein